MTKEYTSELLERKELERKFVVRHSPTITMALKYCMNKDDKCLLIDLIGQAVDFYYGDLPEPKVSAQSLPLFFQVRDDLFRQINGFLASYRNVRKPIDDDDYDI